VYERDREKERERERERERKLLFLNKAAIREDEIKLHMKYWGKYSERERQKYWEKNLSPFYFIYRKSHMD
jgi:hypothetical protein